MSMPSGVDVRTIARGVQVISLLACCAAIALHAPGHVSMDSSIQLYEAATGISVSWNPPFMSALMGWLGGGDIATSALVLAAALACYGGLALVAGEVAHARVATGRTTVAGWRAVLAWGLALNPIVFLYVGIVWKDVLFAALLCAGAAAGIAAARGHWPRRLAFATVSTLLLAVALHARQQGIFMVPVLALIPMFALSAGRRWPSPTAIALVAFVLVLAVLGLRVASEASITGNDGRSSSVGFRSIMVFDMAGIVTNADLPAPAFAHPVSQAQLEAIRGAYDPSRIDLLARDPLAIGWLAEESQEELRGAWWAMVRQSPGAYLRHRATAYVTLLGLRGIEPTAPIHMGVDGREDYLDAVGLPVMRDRRDLLVWDIAKAFFDWPIYRHAFWLLACLAAAVAAWRTRLPTGLGAGVWIILGACGLFYASYLPTLISTDFRYLFAAIPLAGLVGVILLLGATRQDGGGAPPGDG